MAAKRAEQAEPAEAAEPAAEGKVKGRGWRKPAIFAAPVLLVLAVAGAWSAGLLPGGARKPHAHKPSPPIYIDMPEMIANLDSDPRRPRYVKLRARIEVADKADAKAVKVAMPRLQDLFQTYLRDTRPGDLRGSMGTYRLREELIDRADVAVAPAKVEDVLFVEVIVQ